jgi:DNA polymerase-3 subunit epsilon
MCKSRSVVVDVETSGMSAGNGGRVIEVGAVLLEGSSIVAEFNTLIDSGAAIHFGAYRVHGISEEMLRGKPLPEDVWDRFRKFVGAADLVAHNASFDSSFIRHELGLLGYDLPNNWHCTVRLARQKLPHLHNHKLETVYRHLFGTLPPAVQRHRALDDAKLAAGIWMRLM